MAEPVLELDERPEGLRTPALVVAFKGWVDAGSAGQDAVRYLLEHSSRARTIGRLDLAGVTDLAATRPTIEVAAGVVRGVEWPHVSVALARTGPRDVITLSGPEPARNWPSVVSSLADVAISLGVTDAWFLGGMPGVTTHRRPVEVLATTTDEETAERFAPLRGPYAGPTGAQTALQCELGSRGIPSVGLWVQVPPYLTSSPCPPAARALLERLGSFAGISIDLGSFDTRIAHYRQIVDEQLASRPELRTMLEKLEAVADKGSRWELTEGDLPSREDLASEIQRFLEGET